MSRNRHEQHESAVSAVQGESGHGRQRMVAIGRKWSAAVVLVLLGVGRFASADVIVVANRTPAEVAVRLTPVAARPTSLVIDKGEVKPLFVDGRAYISFESRGAAKRYLLAANSAYRFVAFRDGRLDLEEIGLNADQSTVDGRTLPGSPNTSPTVTIPVKILVDEEEPTKQFVWERRLRSRVDRASDILEKHCRLRLKVVAVERWNSDNSIEKFFDSLTEFEDEVDPFPAQLAIGFTNQYQVPTGRVHLGGTRGPFHPHILVREWSRHVGEAERLELLVHELGHFLGAKHSESPNSVMRPVLGDRKAMHANFEIRFDAVNTLIMAMIVEEASRRHVREYNKLTLGTRRRLGQIYGRLNDESPRKPSRPKKRSRVANRQATPPLVRHTRAVLDQIVRVAQLNHNRSAANGDDAEQQPQLSGDELTTELVRAAAAVAADLPEDNRRSALLYGLGIGLDDTDTLQNLPKTRHFVGSVESPGQRSIRTAFLGSPTIDGRRDLARHFFISAYLTAMQGGEAAFSAGLAKEMLDSRQGGSGFSFVDLAADKAGIRFASAVLEKQLPLAELAGQFKIDLYFPTVDGLSEGLSTTQVLAQFGSPQDGRFQQQLREIDRLLVDLPPYRSLQSAVSERGQALRDSAE